MNNALENAAKEIRAMLDASQKRYEELGAKGMTLKDPQFAVESGLLWGFKTSLSLIQLSLVREGNIVTTENKPS
jgi:hypothetical protein